MCACMRAANINVIREFVTEYIDSGVYPYRTWVRGRRVVIYIMYDGTIMPVRR